MRIILMSLSLSEINDIFTNLIIHNIEIIDVPYI